MQPKFKGLKKEFTKRDVERVRNLVQGRGNSSSESQVGYKKKTIKYKEGDVWTENKKTWTIKKGIKQTVSKLDAIRIHKKCLNCVIEFEHKLIIEDKYDDYIKELEAKNSLDIVDDMESYLLSAINTSDEGYVSEGGHVERWVGGVNKEKMTKDITEAAKIRREFIKKKIDG